MKIKHIVALVSGALLVTGCSSSVAVSDKAGTELKQEVNTSMDKSVQEIRDALARLENRQKGVKITETKKPSPIDQTVARTSPVVKLPDLPKEAQKKVEPPKVAGEAVKNPIVAKAGIQVPVKTQVATPAKDIVKKEDVVKPEVEAKPAIHTLDKHINLNWKGEATDLLRSLSNKLGYSYTETGVKKSIPVSVSANNRSVRDVLGLIDKQTGASANIVVSSAAKTITLQYK